MSDQPNPSLYGEAPAPVESAKAPGLLDQVVGVFTEPVALFQQLNKAPSWAWAAGATLLMAFLVTLIWSIKVDLDSFLRPILESQGRTTDQIDQAIPLMKKIGPVLFPLQTILIIASVFAIIALIYWIIGKFLAIDSQPTFVHALSAASVPVLVMLPHSLAVLAMCFAREVGGATPDKLAPTSLAYFVHPESPKLFALLNFVDPFVIASWALTWLATRHLLGLKASGATVCTVLVAGAGIAMRVMGAR